MRMHHWNYAAICVALVAACLSGLDAKASNLDIDEMAAALALPIVTGGQVGNPIKQTNGDVVIPAQDAVTLVTITNGRADDILLRVDMISGDVAEGDGWQSTSFDCELTGRETTTFVFVGAGTGNSRVYVECSRDGDTAARPTARFTNLQNGLLFVAVADPDTNLVVSENVIFGDAIVADVDQGLAYSFGAISFQSGFGLNDGNKVYRFDQTSEYTAFPNTLATNFIAPQEGNPLVEAELILFTLDGTVGNIPGPRAKLGGFIYNDDEVAFDLTYEFECFDIVALDDMNPNAAFTAGGGIGLGSISGHLEMTSQPIATSGWDVHDAQYGDGNNVRRRGVHGWLVQSTSAELLPGNEPVPNAPNLPISQGTAAWARPLAQSTTPLLPFLFPGDQFTVLDADARN